jgi:hypothetical protein
MNYKEEHFKNCQFSPLAKGKMIEQYSRLASIIEPEWNEDPDLDNLIRYVIVMYDPDSPVYKAERDITRRRDLAFDLAGVDDEAKRLMIATHTHNFLPDLIVKYLMQFPRSKEWAMICAMEYTFWESIHKLFEPISGKTSKDELESVQKKATIKDELEKDSERLESHYKKFFGGDEEIIGKTKLLYKPENMFKKVNHV